MKPAYLVEMWCVFHNETTSGVLKIVVGPLIVDSSTNLLPHLGVSSDLKQTNRRNINDKFSLNNSFHERFLCQQPSY